MSRAKTTDQDEPKTKAFLILPAGWGRNTFFYMPPLDASAEEIEKGHEWVRHMNALEVQKNRDLTNPDNRSQRNANQDRRET